MLQGDGFVPLSETTASIIGKEFMVVVDRGGKIEELLQDAVEVGRFKKIDAPYNVGNSLKAVVDDDGQVLTRADVFADNDSVAELLGPGDLFSMDGILPGESSPNYFECL